MMISYNQYVEHYAYMKISIDQITIILLFESTVDGSDLYLYVLEYI